MEPLSDADPGDGLAREQTSAAPTETAPPPVLLEVLDRRGRPVQRLRLEQLPVTIGRAVSNDVQLDDPYVCPAHARIVRDPDGRLVAEDLGSVNGLYAHTPPRRVSRVALQTVDSLRIGHTVVRVRHGATPLAPTMVDRAGADPGAVSRPLSVLLFAAAVAAVAIDAYLDSYGPHATRDAVLESMVVLFLALAWSTGWAFLNRVLGHQWNLLGHFGVACGFIFGMLVLGVIVGYAGFLVSSPKLVDGIEMALAVPLIAALLSGHLRLCSPTPAARRRLASLGAAAAFVGMVELMPRLLSDSFSGDLHFTSSLRPIPTAWLPTHSVDQFLGSLDGVQKEVDLLAKEKP